MATEFDTMDERQRGYQAAKAGKANYRHDRYWIDDNGAELARPDVVKGIMAYYADSDAADLHVTGPTLADWQQQQRNHQIALDNARHYEAQAADALAEAEYLSGDHKVWAIKDAQFFTDNAAFYRSQAAQIAAR